MMYAADKDQVVALIEEHLGSTLSNTEYNSIAVEDGKLKFVLEGTDSQGASVIRMLLDAGFLSVVDENMDTNENAATMDGQGRCVCWIAMAHPQGLMFR
jgi:hypothetical protein